MKSTGIVRKVDELGRIVIPAELRRTMKIDIADPVEIFVDGRSIILRKYEPDSTCLITGEVSENNLSLAGGKIVLSEAGVRQLINEIKGNLG